MVKPNGLITKIYFKKELKKELKKFATKKYLDKNFVTKDYLKKQFQEQFQVFRKLINLDIDFKIDALRDELEEKAKLRHNHVLNLLDKILKEIKDSREERITAGKQIIDHEQPIQKVEQTVFPN